MKCLLTLITFATLSFGALTHAATMTSSDPELQKTYTDIQKTFGTVPSFLKHYPDAGLPSAWEEMKNIQLSSSTVLPGRVKELIGLAVAAQIPCQYCIYLHTAAAKLNGASENEINEAIAVAAGSRHWSTFINGIQYDEEEFQNETDKVVAFTKNQMTKPAESSVSESSTKEEVKPIVVIDSQTAYQDIEKTLGSVPGFFKQFPEASVASAWKMMKTVELNPETELSAKTKELISMSVAAQTPCPNCTYLHTELAKVNGASTAEVKEALAMASVTRFWSTVLNGSQTDFKTFKREADQMMNFMKKQESKKVGMTAITQNSVSR